MDAEIQAGRLLVATPRLDDVNFRRTVVLVVEHVEEEGTLGVVLNRPTEVPVERVLAPWAELVTGPPVIFQGGPVALDGALALALRRGAEVPLGWRALDSVPSMAELGLIDLDAPPQVIGPELSGLRVFAGYAGWGAGQLHGEIEEGAWYVLTGEPSDAFQPDPEVLWRRVLRRQGGDLAMIATFPDDPTLN